MSIYDALDLVSAFRVAKVIRYYLGPEGTLLENIPLIDAVDSHGNAYMRCRFLNIGGGIANDEDELHSFDNWVPPVDHRPEDNRGIEESGEVLLGIGAGRGMAKQTYVLGTIYTPGLREQFDTEDERPGEDAMADYGEKIRFDDRLSMHRGVRVIMAGNGTYLVDTKRTKKPVRFELHPESWVRVSQDDDSSEFVLLGTATLKHIHALHHKLDAIHDKLDELLGHIQSNQAALTAVISAFDAAVGAVIGGGGGAVSLTSAVNAIPTQAQVTAALPMEEPDVHFDISADLDPDGHDGNSNKLKAACFRISSLDLDSQPEES